MGDPFDLSGHRVWITGSAQGIGAATARAFARAGADVVIHGLGQTAEATALCDELRGRGVAAMAVDGDATDPEVVARMAAQIDAGLGGLSVVVNCFGGSPRKSPLADVAARGYRRACVVSGLRSGGLHHRRGDRGQRRHAASGVIAAAPLPCPPLAATLPDPFNLRSPSMPPKDPARSLNNLSFQILGVLGCAPQSGYDIVKQLENFRPAKTSQVYPTLARLEAAGLLTARDVEQSGRPNKKFFRSPRRAATHWSHGSARSPSPLSARCFPDDALFRMAGGQGHVVGAA